MFENITPEGIKQRIFDALGVEVDTREGSYTDALIGPAALEIWKIYTSLNGLIPMVYPDETSGEYIDKRCAYYGIIRKAGMPARSVLTVTGSDGTAVPKGAVFLTADGLRFAADEAAELMDGTASVPVVAATVGANYNVGAGRIMRQAASIPGVTGVNNPSAAVGGADPESDAALLRRLYTRLREPATSGNANHYRQWALEVDGVGAVKVKPTADGPGTVTVLIASPEMGQADSAVTEACAAHIEEMRPIGAKVTVKTVTGLAIDVSATVTVDTSVTKERVQAAFGAALDEYLRSIAFVQYTVPYIRIGYLLAGVDGVLDYSDLKINGDTANVEIGDEQVPQVGAVSLL